VTLVPVAAIFVAGIRLNFLDISAHADRFDRWTSACDISFQKGDEMGWFEHGSTIIVLAPEGFCPVEGVVQGTRIRMGQPLLRLPAARSEGP
jgi:phosphatidylserine decarboxylase